MRKKCFKCNIVKDLTEYYKHKKMGDGHLNKCKDCTKKDTKGRLAEKLKDPSFIESEKSRHRDKYHRLNYKDKHKPTFEQKKKAIDKYKEKYPEKVKARNSSSHLKAKKLGNHLHHWSYNEEHFKDVIEITEKKHYLIHRFMVYEQDKKMYRATHDEKQLLDTKEKHIAYIRLVSFFHAT